MILQEKFKEFWIAHRLLLVTMLTVVVVLIGGYQILISSTSHVEFWPGVGSWVGGIATVYAVFIAVFEYQNRKKVDKVNEITALINFVECEFWNSWLYLVISQLVNYKLRKEIEKKILANEKIGARLGRDFESSLERTIDLDNEYLYTISRFNNLVHRLEVLSPTKYDALNNCICKLKSLRNNTNYLLNEINEYCPEAIENEYSLEYKALADSIVQDEFGSLSIHIMHNSAFKKYKNEIHTDVFLNFLNKLNALN